MKRVALSLILVAAVFSSTKAKVYPVSNGFYYKAVNFIGDLEEREGWITYDSDHDVIGINFSKMSGTDETAVLFFYSWHIDNIRVYLDKWLGWQKNAASDGDVLNKIMGDLPCMPKMLIGDVSHEPTSVVVKFHTIDYQHYLGIHLEYTEEHAEYVWKASALLPYKRGVLLLKDMLSDSQLSEYRKKVKEKIETENKYK